MRTHKLPLILTSAAVVALLAWPATADGQRRGRAGRGRPAVRATVFVGGHYGYYRGFRPYGFYGYGQRFDVGASLRINIDPSDAEVYVDGYYAGRVDDFDNIFQRLHLTPGGHDIVVYLDGYRSLAYSMHFGAFSDQEIKDRLMPLEPGEPARPRPEPAAYQSPPDAPPVDRPIERRRSRAPAREARVAVEVERFGSLAIVVRPVDAVVTVDGETWTVADGDDRLLVRLTEGRHTVEIQKEGFARYTEDVLIREGRTLRLNVSLVRNLR